MLTRMATATGLKNFSHSEAYDFTKSRIGKPMTSQCVSQNLGRNARASGNRPVPLWHNPENVNSVRLKQWFLTGEELLPTGGVNKFPDWREPLRALQHGRFEQLFTDKYISFYNVFNARGGDWNKAQLLNGGVLEKRLRTTVVQVVETWSYLLVKRSFRTTKHPRCQWNSAHASLSHCAQAQPSSNCNA